ncbi:heme exporter protein CcmD [Roseibium denhamense]|uniref:Heme exporter protein D n=2 Tax=Roseibium denhamense TaxID=76305 RepID=A0ABY1PCI7_9HYPH|nr:heme exporter protein CcmD [Roseibium denhamense]MTI07375.1 heme exporter protein CcmD [Roseibium denhamense]SMP29189.1 heme exporter protein D [Roseibium denhamense]
MDLGPHASFILASYGLCVLTVLVLFAWVFLDKAAQDKALSELAAQGVKRAQPKKERS